MLNIYEDIQLSKLDCIVEISLNLTLKIIAFVYFQILMVDALGVSYNYSYRSFDLIVALLKISCSRVISLLRFI